MMRSGWLLVLPIALAGQSANSPTSTTFRTMADARTWPEGVDCASDGRCWMSSLGHRAIFLSSARGEVVRLPAAPAVLPGPATAVRYDATRRLLWVATSTGVGPAPQDGAQSFLLALDPETGRELKRIAPPGGGDHVLGDLAIAADGTVLISDSKPAALHRLAPGAQTMTTITDSLFRSPQGVAVVPGTDWAVLADYSRGLLRVDLRTGAVRRLDDGMPRPVARGTDGIVWHDGAVIGVQNGWSPARITRFVVDDSLTSIRETIELDRPTGADEPTSGTVLDGAFIYVGNSSWEKHDEAGHPLAGKTPTPPMLWRLVLPRRQASKLSSLSSEPVHPCVIPARSFTNAASSSLVAEP